MGDVTRYYAADICAALGIGASDWRARYHRGPAPSPDGYEPSPDSRAFWLPATIKPYLEHARLRRARAERPPT